MQFKEYTIETVAELMAFLADNQSFDSVKGFRSITQESVSSVLRELAEQLRDLSKHQPLLDKEMVEASDFSANYQKVITNLSPQEENILLKSFKIG